MHNVGRLIILDHGALTYPLQAPLAIFTLCSIEEYGVGKRRSRLEEQW